MWAFIKQILLTFGLGRILMSLALLSCMLIILEIINFSPMILRTIYLFLILLGGTTLLSLFDDIRGLHIYLMHLGDKKNLEWKNM
jgi:hypothetical protein